MIKNWILPLCMAGLLMTGSIMTATAVAPPKLHPIAGSPGPDTGESSLYREADGTLHLTWGGPGLAQGERALWHASLPPEVDRWSAPRPIISSALLMENWADFATLTVGTDGTLWAQWFQSRGVDQRGYDGWFSRSADDGKTWSTAARLGHEFVALAPLSNGRVMAVWLESTRKRDPNSPRTKKDPNAPYSPSMRFVARLLGPDGATQQDWVIDPDVCTCCQTSITALPDDRLVVAYRGHTPAEIRDNYVATFDGNSWTTPYRVHPDNWTIAGCPVNGPATDAKGETVGITWFTAANGISRVQAKVSVNGGMTFGPPISVDLGKPMGRLDLISLADGSAVVSWIEAASDENVAGLYVRRIYPDGTSSAARQLGTTLAARASGFARMAVRDFATETIAISFTDAGASVVDAQGTPTTQIRTSTFSAANLLPEHHSLSRDTIHRTPDQPSEAPHDHAAHH